MLLRRGLLALAASCVLCLPGCGGSGIDAGEGDNANTSGGTGGVAAAGQPAGGAAVAATAGTGGSGGSAGQAAAAGGMASQAMCSTFMDVTTAWSLTVQITNQRKEAVYLGQDSATCDAQRLFQVEDGSRAVLPSLDGCHSSCQALMATGPASCPTTCQTPSTLTLNPGQTIKIPWDGRYAVPQSLPQQCVNGATQATISCVQAQRIEASVFTFSARAGTSHSCMAAGGCTCTADQYGTCTTPSSLITGTIITTEYLLKLEPGEAPFIGLTFKD